MLIEGKKKKHFDRVENKYLYDMKTTVIISAYDREASLMFSGTQQSINAF